MPEIETRDLLLIRNYIIEKIIIEARVKIPRHVLLNMEVAKYPDYIGNNAIYQFRSYLAGKKSRHERIDKTIDIPLSWWDHTKERFAPKWFLKRWPVSYRTILVKTIISTTHICPHIELPSKDKQHFDWLCSVRSNGAGKPTEDK